MANKSKINEAPTNIQELRDSLSDNYQQMKTEAMPIELGKELSNAAGKMIKSCAIELDYNRASGQPEKKIGFLDV